MNQDEKPTFDARALAGISARHFVKMFGRVFVLGWFVYGVFRFYTSGEYGIYVFWAMFLLSIFGLWQAIRLLEKALKLTDERMRP